MISNRDRRQVWSSPLICEKQILSTVWFLSSFRFFLFLFLKGENCSFKRDGGGGVWYLQHHEQLKNVIIFYREPSQALESGTTSDFVCVCLEGDISSPHMTQNTCFQTTIIRASSLAKRAKHNKNIIPGNWKTTGGCKQRAKNVVSSCLYFFSPNNCAKLLHCREWKSSSLTNDGP